MWTMFKEEKEERADRKAADTVHEEVKPSERPIQKEGEADIMQDEQEAREKQSDEENLHSSTIVVINQDHYQN